VIALLCLRLGAIVESEGSGMGSELILCKAWFAMYPKMVNLRN
jgi:hypothetical protein